MNVSDNKKNIQTKYYYYQVANLFHKIKFMKAINSIRKNFIYLMLGIHRNKLHGLKNTFSSNVLFFFRSLNVPVASAQQVKPVTYPQPSFNAPTIFYGNWVPVQY